MYLQVSLKTWNQRRNLLSKQLTSSVVSNKAVCPVLNCCSFVNSKKLLPLHVHIFSPYNILLQYMIFKNTSRLYYCSHSPLTCLTRKNITIIPDPQSSPVTLCTDFFKPNEAEFCPVIVFCVSYN